MPEDSYELMYGSGGHAGPHFGLDAARARAKLLLEGSRSEQTIYIVPRDDRTLDRRNAVEVVHKERRSGADRRGGI